MGKPTLLVVHQGTPYRKPSVDYNVDAAVKVTDGIAYITKATAAAMTIADPGASDDDAELLIISTTAAAHTIDNSAGSGFNGGGAGSDIATFTAVIGNNLKLVAKNGVWLVQGSINATLA